jgi:hypothetical protein
MLSQLAMNNFKELFYGLATKNGELEW